MLVLKPQYYNKFKCIAENCKDSCCIGWQISVDKASFNRYRKINQGFGQYLNRNVCKNRKNRNDTDYGKISLSESGRCNFLNESNLCQIYINLGEEFLCNTCKEYPRYVKRFGDRYEKTMTISCPEVARLIVESEEPISFEMVEEEMDKMGIKNSLYDKQLEKILWDVRMLLIEIAQFREIPVWKRLIFIKQTIDRVQKLIENQNYNDKVISILSEYVQNENNIMALDSLRTDKGEKNIFIKDVFNFRMTTGTGNDMFLKFTKDIGTFQELLDEKRVDITNLENEFNVYFYNKEYILEHYMVYYIYGNFMNAVWSNDLKKEISALIINCILIKHMLLVRWYNRGKRLETSDIIDAIYSFSRSMEHNLNFKEDFYRAIRRNDIDDLECMATFVK